MRKKRGIVRSEHKKNQNQRPNPKLRWVESAPTARSCDRPPPGRRQGIFYPLLLYPFIPLSLYPSTLYPFGMLSLYPTSPLPLYLFVSVSFYPFILLSLNFSFPPSPFFPCSVSFFLSGKDLAFNLLTDREVQVDIKRPGCSW